MTFSEFLRSLRVEYVITPAGGGTATIATDNVDRVVQDYAEAGKDGEYLVTSEEQIAPETYLLGAKYEDGMYQVRIGFPKEAIDWYPVSQELVDDIKSIKTIVIRESCEEVVAK